MKSEPMEMPEMKPRLHLTAEDLPEIEGWEVGQSYKVMVELKQVSKSEREEPEEGEKEMCADFEIMAIKPLPTRSSFSKDDVKAALSMKKTMK